MLVPPTPEDLAVVHDFAGGQIPTAPQVVATALCVEDVGDKVLVVIHGTIRIDNQQIGTPQTLIVFDRTRLLPSA